MAANAEHLIIYFSRLGDAAKKDKKITGLVGSGKRWNEKQRMNDEVEHETRAAAAAAAAA
jgi:hypothetical protein